MSELLYVQMAEILVVGLGFLFTLRRLKISLDARNVDFVIQTEGQIDPLFVNLLNAQPVVARKVFP